MSGRGVAFYPSLLKKYPGLEVDFFVGCNGGVIIDQNQTRIHEAICKIVSVADLIDTLFGLGGRFVNLCAVESAGERCFCVVRSMQDVPPKSDLFEAVHPNELPLLEGFFMASIVADTVERAAELTARIRAVYGKHLTPLQNGKWIDIVPLGVNKAEGMRRVMEYYGGEHEDVLVVGDNVNDMDMIRAFRSYAMESGVEELKEIAYGVVGSVTDLLVREL